MDNNKSFLRSVGDWCLSTFGFGIKASIVTGVGLIFILAIGGTYCAANVGGFIGKVGYVTSFRWLTDNPYN